MDATVTDRADRTEANTGASRKRYPIRCLVSVRSSRPAKIPVGAVRNDFGPAAGKGNLSKATNV